MRKLLLSLFLLSISLSALKAQNCTVNAGVDRTYCVNDTITLTGNRAGNLVGSSTWTQVSGPSVIINSPNSLNTQISGKVPGTMVFNIRNRCQDGSNANDIVTITILGVTRANAGPDKSMCPGNDTLAANTPGSGETGVWTYTVNNGSASIGQLNNPQSQIALGATNGGLSLLTWTISNSNGCSSSDDVQYINYGGYNPVSIWSGDSIELSQCYSVYQTTVLTGSYSGTGLGGQSGQWTTISGPSNPLLVSNNNTGNVSFMIQGTYMFEYRVNGPCASGVDTIKVKVPPPLGELSPSVGQTIYLCDRPTSVTLNGAVPIYRNDTSSWIQLGGPTTVVFNPVNAPTTTVSNLRGQGGDIYQFHYIMANGLTGCRSTALFTISYLDTPTLDVFQDRILPCDQDTAILRYNFTGGLYTNFSQVSGPKLALTGLYNGSDTLSRYTSVSGMDSSGVYIFRITQTSGTGQSCIGVQEDVKFIVSHQPDDANAGSAQRLDCNVDTTQLAANIPAPGVGTWYQNSGPSNSVIEDSLKNITTVRNLSGGLYNYRWLINGGQSCYPTQDDVAVLVADTLPAAAAGGSDQTICFLSVLHLQGNMPNPGSSGVWKAIPDSGLVFSDSNSNVTRVTGMDSTINYKFIWKVYNSCGFNTDTVDVFITSDIAAIPADAGDDRCLPDTTSSFVLDGNIPWPGTGKWTKISGPSDSIVNDTVYNTLVFPSGPGTYKYQWSIGNGFCNAGLDTVVITLSDTVTTAFAGADRDTCSNDIVLRGNQPVYGLGRWSLLIGQINGNMLYPDSFITPVTDLAQGTYIYRWTIDNGACGISHDDVKMNVANPTTVPQALTGDLWCYPNTIVIQANRITKGRGYWSLQGYNPTQATINRIDSSYAVVSNLAAGIYTFKWNSVNPMGICPDLYSLRQDTIVFPADAGTDRNLCKQYNITLTGTTNSSGFWRQVSGDSAQLDSLTPNKALASQLTSAGSPYKFMYEIRPRYSCAASFDSVVIRVFDSTTSPFAGVDQNLCDADTVQLAANDVSPDDGVWSQVSGPSTVTFSNSTSYNSQFYNIVGGSYLLKWKSSNLGCERSDFVVIRNFDSSVLADAGADTSVCPPFTQLNAIFNSTNSASWSQISGPNTAVIRSSVNPGSTIENLIKGTYKFEWRVNNGYCPANMDTVEITVPYDQPTTAIAGNLANICDNDSFIMNGNSPLIGSGLWTQITGDSVNIVDDTLYNTVLYNLDTGVSKFLWTIENGNCSSSDTMEIQVDELPSAALASGDSGYCLYNPVIVTATQPVIGTGQWSQINGSGANILTPNNLSSYITGLNAGQYQFIWSVINGVCPPSKDTVEISIDSIPSLSDAGPDINTCLGSAYFSATTPSSGTGTWHFISGIDTPYVLSPHNPGSFVNNLDSGRYTYEWEVARGGCKSRDTMRIILDDPQPNDQCLDPDDISNPGGTYFGDLCGAKRFGAEPNTAGYNACNTIFYRFHTVGYNYRKQINITILNTTDCYYGLRLSLFDSGSCPGLGMQHDTTIIANGTGLYTFDSLKSNQGYILVIDENRNPCAKTECTLTFNLSGNALPVDLLNFEVKPVSKGVADILWTAHDDKQIVQYIIRKTVNSETTELGRIQGQMSSGSSQYFMRDANVTVYPVSYELLGLQTNGTLKSFGTRVLFSNDIMGNLFVYPNPTNGAFNLQYTGDDSYRLTNIKVYDSKGVLVYEQDKIRLSNLPSIDTHDWSEGLYHVVVQIGDKTISLPIVVSK